MVPKFMLRLSVLLAAVLLSGCYILQAAHGQLAVMRARQPIDKVIASPRTADTLKAQLIRARDVREFASRELGLPDNGAYRSYADIGRPYVVWNVVAAPEFSVQPLQWCFPVAGCVAYRGYFSEKAAKEFAAGLKGKGNDVVVGGVPAYSTLGHMADPLLNTVIGYGELDLAALVFHELAHQVAYLPGDSAFNEAFATAVEEAGVARYAAQLSDPALLQRWQQRRRLRIEITELITTARDDLDRIYQQGMAPEAMREAKARRLAGLATAIRAVERREDRNSGYGTWIDEGLNNAHLVSVATYYDQVPHFEQLLHEQCGDWLPCLYTRVNQEIVARREAQAARPRPAGSSR